MNDNVVFSLAFAAALGAGVVAGVFFAFSTFVMKALSRLPSEQAVAAMQSINIVAINPLFMTVLFGTAAACLVLAVLTASDGNHPGAVYLFAGSLLYIAGVAFVTMTCNVPRNDRLAAMAPGSTEAAGYWPAYFEGWTRWNHVRTVASLAASALLFAGVA